MELYVLGSESDTSGRGGSADGRLGCQQQQLVHPVVTSSLCQLHSAEGLPTGFRPTKGCAVIAEQNRLSLLCACMRACFFFFTTLYLQTDNCLCCFRKLVAVPPSFHSVKNDTSGFIGRESQSKSARYEENTGYRWECAPPPPRTWQTNTAVTPLALLPNADLILPVGRVVLIAGAAAAMNIHTALPFWAGGPGC